jgi:NAD(P) transhydrogenase subunit alpha
MIALTVFVLAIFLGFELIAKVPPTLHTPLMSGANAISGVTIVGALTCAYMGQTDSLNTAANVLGAMAVATATVNVVGGFMVTDRMLGMFASKKKAK